MHIISVMKIALVHDDFNQFGGAESLFATIAVLFPSAPIYTSLVNWGKLPQSISRDRIKTSFMQKIPLAGLFYKILLPFYPLAFESFNFEKYDIVLSSTTRFAKSIITSPNTVHICYINSTPRFLWDEKVKKEYLLKFFRRLLSPILLWLKRWDRIAAERVDIYIANSQNTAGRVKKYYGRDSIVIYPFANVDFFKSAKVHNWQLKSQNYYLLVSRLVRWKKIDIAINAAQSLGVNLKIAGTGPDEGRLKKLSNVNGQLSNVRNTEFIGKVTKEELREFYQNCQALIVTQEEDFGIAALEAQACGIPVIAFDAGGLREIIVDGKTGILYQKQTSQSLQDAIVASSRVKWNVLACRKNAQRFSKVKFVNELRNHIKDLMLNPKSEVPNPK